jgi:hypothetical protein
VGKYEVTQAQFEHVLSTNPSYYKGAERPVENLDWYAALRFCRELTRRERDAGRLPSHFEYRLPTEAEWEFCARAGTETAYYFGFDPVELADNAWFHGNSRQTHNIGAKTANPWGLFDVLGNVGEWCLDYADWDDSKSAVVTDTYEDDLTDPFCSIGVRNIVRGGGWSGHTRDYRIATRSAVEPWSATSSRGFRVVLGPALATPEDLPDLVTFHPREQPGVTDRLCVYAVMQPLEDHAQAHPAKIISRCGRLLSAEQRDQLRARDGKFFGGGFLQIYRVPNPGDVRLSWTGRATGSGRVAVQTWQGEAYATQRFDGVLRRGAFVAELSVPSAQKFLYVLLSSEDGLVYTDQIGIE